MKEKLEGITLVFDHSSRGECPKIAILHDAFLYRGGGERLVTLMAKSLGADLISGFFSEGSFDPRELGFDGKIIPLGRPVFRKGIRHLVLKWRFFWKARILRDYDIVIFSGDCLGALRHVRNDAQKVYYCHTPPRYLYDFRSKYLAGLPMLVRPIFSVAFSFFAHIYERNLKKFDQIFTNSETVQKRLHEYTSMDSSIIYPPTDTEYFRCASSQHSPEGDGVSFTPSPLGGRGDGGVRCSEEGGWGEEYFLSWARLSPPKRVDHIVDTFLTLPEKNLIFSYGKNDPMKESILEKIKDAKNIIAIESPSDEVLLRLIQGATATLYIPIDEDFGMTPVESMACGIPVIGANEGGLRETIIHEKTGLLIDVSPENLVRAIQKMTPEYALSLQENCIDRAKEFSLEKFQKKLQSKLEVRS